MSNYSKTTNFAVKDALVSGDPLKAIKGTDINTEFDNIATAVATKTDNAGAAITSGSINGTTIGNSTPSTGAFTTLSASGALTGTLGTAAQPNVTSLGTLTSLTTSGAITMTAAASKLVPGATSFSHRNTADSADNLLIADAGAITGRTSITATTGLAVGAATAGAGGVAFPATAVAVADVNTLDDYEEGSWTPSVGGTATYSQQVGTYTKIGRLVFVRCFIAITTIGTGSTTVISGLPFAAASGTFYVTIGDSAACVTNVVSIVGRISSSTVTLLSRTAASASDAINAIFQNATEIRFSGSYEV